MIELDRDRRAHPRFRVQRPAKVFCPRTGRYYVGETRDFSKCGLRLELELPVRLNPGDELLIGIAEKRRQPLLRTEAMVRAHVVCAAAATDRGSTVAVQFDCPAAVAPPLDLPRAA